MSKWEVYKETMGVPSSLCTAAASNDIALIERLLASGAVDIDQPDARGYTPLMLAAYRGHVDAFELLLAHGANPNTCDLAGNSVLMGAAFKGHVGLVERLLEHGADPTTRCPAGLDAYAYAKQFGREEVLPILSRALAKWGAPPGTSRSERRSSRVRREPSAGGYSETSSSRRI